MLRRSSGPPFRTTPTWPTSCRATVIPVSMTTRMSAITARTPVAIRSARWRGIPRNGHGRGSRGGRRPWSSRPRRCAAALRRSARWSTRPMKLAGRGPGETDPRRSERGSRSPAGDRVMACVPMAYTWRTKWPGIMAQHADHCRVRDGAECSCGPIGYPASVEDPENGEPGLSPTLETLAEARAWRHEQSEAFDAWRASSDERPTDDAAIEDLLAAAARASAPGGGARDRSGRRFDADGLRGLRWALTGHVHEELGSMAISEVRTR